MLSGGKLPMASFNAHSPVMLYVSVHMDESAIAQEQEKRMRQS